MLFAVLRGMGIAELGGFRGAFEGGGGGGAAGDGLLHGVEIGGADEALVLNGFVAVLAFLTEFFLLEAAIRGHAGVLVLAGEIEHAHVEREWNPASVMNWNL